MIFMFNDDAVVPKGDRPGDGLIEHMRQHDVINVSERHAGGMPPSEHADWVIDLARVCGVNGGSVVVEGMPDGGGDAGLIHRSISSALARPSDYETVVPSQVEGRSRHPRKRKMTEDIAAE
jgi:hypothetical protein